MYKVWVDKDKSRLFKNVSVTVDLTQTNKRMLLNKDKGPYYSHTTISLLRVLINSSFLVWNLIHKAAERHFSQRIEHRCEVQRKSWTLCFRFQISLQAYKLGPQWLADTPCPYFSVHFTCFSHAITCEQRVKHVQKTHVKCVFSNIVVWISCETHRIKCKNPDTFHMYFAHVSYVCLFCKVGS